VSALSSGAKETSASIPNMANNTIAREKFTCSPILAQNSRHLSPCQLRWDQFWLSCFGVQFLYWKMDSLLLALLAQGTAEAAVPTLQLSLRCGCRYITVGVVPMAWIARCSLIATFRNKTGFTESACY
jgi:hypothetical protein